MDTEKVIKAIECCVVNKTRCFDDKDKLCPYLSTSYMCEIELLKDALTLLKKQEGIIKTLENKNTKLMLLVNEYLKKEREAEAVEPIKMQRMDSNFSFFVPYFLCGNCRYELIGKDVMFCSHCGRPVKWK